MEKRRVRIHAGIGCYAHLQSFPNSLLSLTNGVVANGNQ